jgi:site-specific DNA-adenine methylase
MRGSPRGRRAVFDYYGGKTTLARFYQTPRFGTIVEPFAGSAMYSVYHLSQNKELRAVLADKNPRVCETWCWLKSQTPDTIAALPEPKAGEWTTDFLVMNCAASTASLNCSGMTVSDRMAGRFPSLKRKIASFLWILPRVTIVCGSYDELPNVEATWYVDPPYQPHGVGLVGNGYAKGCRAEDLDFAALGAWCKERSGQTIVAEKEGADWLPFRPLRRVTDSQDKHYCEVVWNSKPDNQMELGI